VSRVTLRDVRGVLNWLTGLLWMAAIIVLWVIAVGLLWRGLAVPTEPPDWPPLVAGTAVIGAIVGLILVFGRTHDRGSTAAGEEPRSAQ
jgi:hypothetical protein